MTICINSLYSKSISYTYLLGIFVRLIQLKSLYSPFLLVAGTPSCTVNLQKLLLWSTDSSFANHDVSSWLLLTPLFFVNFLVGTVSSEMPISFTVETNNLCSAAYSCRIVPTLPVVHFKDVVSFLRTCPLNSCP